MAAIAARTKLQYAEEGEKSTRYFYTKNNLDTITETPDIITETHAFYQNLYSSQPADPVKQNEFLNIATPTLAPNGRLLCEGHITEN